MAIKAVEIQGVVQRSQDIGQIKQNQDMKPQTDQNNIHVQIQKQGEQNSKQVTKYENSDKKENRYDAKEKGNGFYFGKEQKKRQFDEEEENDGQVSVKDIHDGFDVKI